MSGPIWRIVLTKVKNAGFIGFTGLVASYIGIVAFVESMFAKYVEGDAGLEALFSALTLVTFFYLLVGLSVFCGISQLKLTEELERVTKARNNLEAQLLKRRRSSRQKKRK